MAEGRHHEGDSTYRFQQRLKQESANLREVREGLGLLAQQARQDHPVEAALSAEIERAYAEVAAIEQDAEGWHALAVSDERGRRDRDRVEQPRKGPRQEANADVSRAIRTV